MITCPQCDSGIEQIIETAPGQGIWRCRGCKALYVQDAPLKPMKRPSQGPLADTLRIVVSLETELAESRREFCRVNGRLDRAVRHIAGLEDPLRAEYEASRRAEYVGKKG